MLEVGGHEGDTGGVEPVRKEAVGMDAGPAVKLPGLEAGWTLAGHFEAQPR
jgi:hypothetical protein